MPIYKKSGQKKFQVRVNYVDSSGKYRTKYATANSYLEAAQKYEELYKNRFLEQKLTLGNLCEDYKNSVKPRLKMQAYLSLCTETNKILKGFGDSIYIKDITPALVRTWNSELLNSNYSQFYIKHLNGRLQTILHYAEQYYGLKQNAAKLAREKLPKISKERNILTIDDFICFMNCIDKEKELTYWVIFQVLFFTGCRVGEVLALFPSDIDFIENTINIDKTYFVCHGKKYLNSPKTDKSIRKIKIPPFLVKILADYIEKLPVQDIRIFFNASLGGISKKRNVICKRAGLQRISTHDFRHSAASYLIAQNIPILEVSQRLGHTTPITTYKTYAHLYPNKDKEIAELEEKDFDSWDFL